MAKGKSVPGIIHTKIVANTRGFVKGMDEAAKKSKKTLTTFQKLSRVVRFMGRAFKAVLSPLARFARALKRMVFSLKSLIIGGVGIFAFVRFVKQSVQLAASFDAAQFAMGNLVGSMQVAKKIMADLQQFTIVTPFRFTELVESARVLAGFGVQAKKILPTLRALGDIAASVNTDIKPLVLGFGKALARNRVDIRILDIFFRRGIPLISELGKVLGVTNQEVLKAVTAGRVQFEHFEAAIANMTAIGTPFFNMMLELSKRTAGLWESTLDTFEKLQRTFGQIIIDEFKLNPLMLKAINFLQEHGEQIGKRLGDWLARAAKNAVKVLIVMERLGSVLLGFAEPKNLKNFFHLLKFGFENLARFFGASILKFIFAAAPRLATLVSFQTDLNQATLESAVRNLNIFTKSLARSVPKSRLDDFAKDVINIADNWERMVNATLAIDETAIPTLKKANELFGAGGTGKVLTVAQQELGEFLDRMKEAVATSGLSRGQKLLRTLNGIADGFKNASVNAKDYGLALKLILTQSITDAEKLLKATRTLASVPGVGAIAPGTQESARLRFAAVNPITKGVGKIVTNTARTAIEGAKTALNTKSIADDMRAIAALGALQSGHIP